ncbi:MAG: VOC family protein [Acidobacteriales bacterium]|nr:VOC family protein [Terriglobales bacterium]
MKLHISLDVNQVEESRKFYATLFGVEATKVKPGYAKFDLDEPAVVLALNERAGSFKGISGLNHMGVRVAVVGTIITAKQRLEQAGYKTADETGVTCCYAVQDKIWAVDPNGYRWEVYVVHGDTEQSDYTPSKEVKELVAGCGCK